MRMRHHAKFVDEALLSIKTNIGDVVSYVA